MQEKLKSYKITELYHFTDESNLPSIRKHGLLSLAELRRQGIVIPVPGGNDWSHDEDQRRGLDHFVHLTFKAEHPMLHVAQKKENRIPNPVWLCVSTDIVKDPNVRYTLGVANRKGEKLLTAAEAIECLDFEVLFTKTDWKNEEIKARLKSARKSEILIPNHVPVKMIIGKIHG